MIVLLAMRLQKVTKKHYNDMKKTLLLIVALLSFATSFAQSSMLLKIVKAMNDECPQKVDEGVIWKSVQYQAGDSYLYYNFSFDESLFGPISIIRSSQKNMDDVVEGIRVSFDGPEMKAVNEVYIEANVNIVFRYVGNKSGDTLDIIYNPKTKKAFFKH